MSDFTGYIEVSTEFRSPGSHSTECDLQLIPKKRDRDESKEEDLEPGSDAYRKARKRRQNRESAARTRARQVDCTRKLKAEVTELEKENQQLYSEVTSLKETVLRLRGELDYYRSLTLGIEMSR